MSATECVKAVAECIAKAKFVIERIGDFDLSLRIMTLALI
jgi:hypothetical protein